MATETKAFLERKAAEEGFSDPEAFLGKLLEEFRHEHDRRRIEEHLDEGKESGFVEMAPEDWKRLKAEFMENRVG